MEVQAMRLFTSNSDIRIIGKICLYTLLLGILYYGVAILITKDLNGANQWQTNLLKAQDYVFEDKPYTHVFVGSSEAYNVPVSEISPKWANLGFASGCSLTGLEVILRSEKHVDVIVVEVNETLLRDVDEALLQEVTFWHGLPMGRQNTRLDYLVNLGKNKIKSLVQNKRERKVDDNMPKLDNLNRTQTRMSTEIDEEKMRLIMMNLKRQIDIIQSRGTRVILTETPNDPSLHDLYQLAETRRLVNEIFPKSEYERYEVNWQEYKTKDGIHLADLSAIRYAEQLVNEF